MAAVGWLLQRFILERSARGGTLLPILTTFGLSIVIDNLLFEQFGADTRSLAPFIGNLSYASWQLPGHIFVGKLAVLMMVTAMLILGGLQFFLSRFALGRAIRATAEDPDTAGLVGIDARRVNAVATAITMVTVGIAGAFLGMRATFSPYLMRPTASLRLRGGRHWRSGITMGDAFTGHRSRSCPIARRAIASARLPDRRPCRVPAGAFRQAVPVRHAGSR